MCIARSMLDIDAVITWVDGADPLLAAKRAHYLSNAAAPLHDNGTNPHRWACSDELSFCLRSIANNAPWIRRVWIVTDGQIPDLNQLLPDFSAKITIVDHRDIFSGHEHMLPTFNSLSIETMLWRIDGLAEHFLYFNDDVFLTAPAQPSDFFVSDAPVLRGKWMDYGYLPDCSGSRDDASLLFHYNQINAAAMIGYTADHVFDSAHVVHPMLRSIMAQLFDTHRDAFIQNAAFRFRDAGQFVAQSLHNHACLTADNAAILDTVDYLHVAVGAFATWTADDVHAFLASAERHAVKFLCVNDLPEVERNFPAARAWIEGAIGGTGGRNRRHLF
jgi:Stealth protein CR2, conserved region 2/Stealth protein CR1, conserved region 1